MLTGAIFMFLKSKGVRTMGGEGYGKKSEPYSSMIRVPDELLQDVSAEPVEDILRETRNRRADGKHYYFA